MKRIGYVVAVIAIVVVAAWTYRVNYETMAALERIEALRDAKAGTEERIRVLEVEWAFLNAPDRLTRLVARHAKDLGLQPIDGRSFAHAALVPFAPGTYAPPPEAVEVAAEVEDLPPVAPEGIPLPPRRPVQLAGARQ